MQARDIVPPVDPGEIVTVTFDFGYLLAQAIPVGGTLPIPPSTQPPPAVQIANIAPLNPFTCAVVTGSDPSPQTRIIGSSLVIPSPTTGTPAGAVTQQFGNMLGGVKYRIACFVVFTNGDTQDIWGHITCKQPV